MPTTSAIVRFGVFELDPGSKQLSKLGRKLKLQEQPFLLLSLLLEHPGELISREKLREALWPADTFVDFDHSLNAAVAKLRQALGDSASNPRFIETVSKGGYRFIAPVEYMEIPDANSGNIARSFAPFQPVEAQGESSNAPGEQQNGLTAARARASHSRMAMASSRTAVASAVAAAVIGAATLLAWRLASPPAEHRELVKLTSDPGLTMGPAVSPDGKLLAYASDRGGSGNLNIWIQQFGRAEKAVQLTHDGFDAREPVFSPDGATVAYRSGGRGGGIFAVPVIGGEPSRITAFGRNPRFSPDGKSIAFWHGGSDFVLVPGAIKGAAWTVSATGGEPKRLGADVTGPANPVWSPGGKRLLVYVPPSEGYLWDQADWWLVPLDGRPSVRTGNFAELRRQGFSVGFDRVPAIAQWTGDSIIFSAAFGDSVNLWRAPVSRDGRITRRAERLTSGTTFESSASWRPDGALVFASLSRIASVWSLPADADTGSITGELKKISAADSEFMPSVSMNGETVALTAVRSRQGALASGALSQEAGQLETRVRNLASGAETAVHGPDGPQWRPQISHDGRVVAWTLGKPGAIFAESLSQKTPRLIIPGRNGFVWDWSPDNKRILFNRFDPPGQRLYLADLETGRERPFAERPGFTLFQAQFSPDGQAVALLGCRGDCQIFIAPVENDHAAAWKNWVAIDHVSNWDDKPRWSPSGDLLYFVSDRDGYLCLWAQRIDRRTKKPSGRPFAVYHLHTARLSMSNLDTGALEIAVAKNRILLGLGEFTGNVWSLTRQQH
jgi:eukaryotic-like serine/threonine-protein kinase